MRISFNCFCCSAEMEQAPLLNSQPRENPSPLSEFNQVLTSSLNNSEKRSQLCQIWEAHPEAQIAMASSLKEGHFLLIENQEENGLLILIMTHENVLACARAPTTKGLFHFLSSQWLLYCEKIESKPRERTLFIKQAKEICSILSCQALSLLKSGELSQKEYNEFQEFLAEFDKKYEVSLWATITNIFSTPARDDVQTPPSTSSKQKENALARTGKVNQLVDQSVTFRASTIQATDPPNTNRVKTAPSQTLKTGESWAELNDRIRSLNHRIEDLKREE